MFSLFVVEKKDAAFPAASLHMSLSISYFFLPFRFRCVRTCSRIQPETVYFRCCTEQDRAFKIMLTCSAMLCNFTCFGPISLYNSCLILISVLNIVSK